MVTVKNRTNSPYDLQGRDGPVRLPAFGEVEGEFEPDYLHILEASMAVEIDYGSISEGEGQSSSEDDPLAQLRADYLEVVGKKPYYKWDAAELQKRIDAKLAE